MRWLALDLDRLRSVMVTPAVVDLRNIYQPEELKRQGLAYACVEKARMILRGVSMAKHGADN
jgi:hypothetical protein